MIDEKEKTALALPCFFLPSSGNDRLRSRLRTYEDVISRNNLWHFFSGSRGKNRNRDDAR